MKRSLFAAVALFAACTTPAPPPQTRPVAAPDPVRSQGGLTQSTTAAPVIPEPRIRVGLLSDQASVTFPRIDGGYFIVGNGATSTLKRGFTVAAPLSTANVRYAVQATAISDETSATTFADRIRTETGQRVDIVFDPASGVRRVLVGDFADTASANPLREQLTSRGYGKDMLVVKRPTDQPFERVHRITDDEGEQYTIPADFITVIPATAETITIDKKPYRTAARLFINPRGMLNIINELNMEEYIRGVVPAELGPKIYDELEALKAQAVAARTYAFRNLGQFNTEGYDICPGPACQAYVGFSGEDKLSDQATRETAGMVMTYQGKMIDALYTSTCGGETSDVNTMFPGRNEPYLKRARCVEYEMVSLAGRADSGLLNEHQLNARLFAAVAATPDSGAWGAADVDRAIAAAARLVGMTVDGRVGPRSSRRRDVLRHLATTLALGRYAQTLLLPEDRQYFFGQSEERDENEYLAAAFLVKYGFLPAQHVDRIDLDAAMPREELYGILGSWLRKHNALTESTGKIIAVDGRRLMLKAEGKVTPFAIPEGVPVFRRLGDRYQEYKNVPIMIGDRAFVQSNARKTPIAVIVQANVDGASFDRTSSFANWTRSFRADELVTSINRRVPIQQLQGIRPLRVDESKRIAEMEFTAEGGRTFILKGLPIRWSLNVPDNLFVYEKTTDPDGVDRYTFFGKGWGHGIGMCQVGAYGMAFRGYTYDQILKRYYTGVDIVPVAQASR